MRFFLTALALLSTSTALMANDIVISGGRVIDPDTGLDAIRNVAIEGDKILAISELPLKGDVVIDATGHIVAPGFIDTHFHFQAPIGYHLGLRDGLTSSMDFEMGCAGSYIAAWYKEREGVTQANFGCAVSHEFARAMVIDGSDGADYLINGPIAAYTTRAKTGWSQTRPTLEQGNAILQELDKGLQAGAPGIGSTTGYMREGISSREMYEVQKVGARYGRPSGAHTRYTLGTDTTEVNGAQELITNAIALGVPAIVLHFNNPGWRVTHELISRLQERGFDIWGEIYPYAATAESIFGPCDFPLDQLQGNPHPRSSGTRSLSLRLGRKNNIPMMQLMSILSYNAAKHMGDTGLKAMQERGRIQTGMVADIVVFEPEDKPRFVPISVASWNAEFSTGMPNAFTGAFPVDGGK